MPLVHTTTLIFQRARSIVPELERYGIRVVSALEGVPVAGRVTRAKLEEGLLANAPEIEYLVTGTTRVSASFLQKAERLRLIAMFGVGVDHIDMDAATRSGVPVANAPGANAVSVAELVLGLMLSLARHIPRLHAGIVSGQWLRIPGRELAGKTLGLIGFGHTAKAVARLGSCLGMRVLVWMRNPDEAAAREYGVELTGLDDLLARSDYVSLHVPGGGDGPLLGAAQLRLLRPEACLINTARGSVVDFEALYQALASGRLAGAALDVFPQEPPDVSHPLFSLPNVVLAPHAGAMTQEAFEAVSRACLQAIVADLRGEQPPTVLNPEAYRHPRWQEGGLRGQREV